MAGKGKRIKVSYEQVDRDNAYELDAAVKLLKDNATAKFDETIELSMNLGVDPRHSDQMVRGVVSLPKGTGKAVRVAVFAKGKKLTRPRRLAQMSSVRTIWPRRSKRAKLISNA